MAVIVKYMRTAKRAQLIKMLKEGHNHGGHAGAVKP